MTDLNVDGEVRNVSLILSFHWRFASPIMLTWLSKVNPEGIASMLSNGNWFGQKKWRCAERFLSYYWTSSPTIKGHVFLRGRWLSWPKQPWMSLPNGERCMCACTRPMVMSFAMVYVCLSYLCLFSLSLSPCLSRERRKVCLLYTNIAFSFTFIYID